MDIDEIIRGLRIRVGGARWLLDEAGTVEARAEAEEALRVAEAELAAALEESGWDA